MHAPISIGCAPIFTSWHRFQFDRVFDTGATQGDVWRDAANDVVGDVLKGYNAAIIAYGQTGAGKTYTMEGVGHGAGAGGAGDDLAATLDSDDDGGGDGDARARLEAGMGIIPRACRALFEHALNSGEHMEFEVRVSMLEIYCERIRDLLNPESTAGGAGGADAKPTSLRIREEKGGRGVFVEGLTKVYATDWTEMLDIMRTGSSNRATAATGMNKASSRSHCLFITEFHQRDNKNGEAQNGTLFLVDLAGSELLKRTDVRGKHLEEAKNINKSLSSLGNVIKALTSHDRDRDDPLATFDGGATTDGGGGDARRRRSSQANPVRNK